MERGESQSGTFRAEEQSQRELRVMCATLPRIAQKCLQRRAIDRYARTKRRKREEKESSRVDFDFISIRAGKDAAKEYNSIVNFTERFFFTGYAKVKENFSRFIFLRRF